MDAKKAINGIIAQLGNIHGHLEGKEKGELARIISRLEKLEQKIEPPVRRREEVTAEKKIQNVICQPAGKEKGLRMSSGEKFV
ncbi:MAG: hypothetical protein J5I94_03855 [Phaeodactylibacter sp.]|nr:hypothetical protein [Phaeodactylibacter sp.]